MGCSRIIDTVFDAPLPGVLGSIGVEPENPDDERERKEILRAFRLVGVLGFAVVATVIAAFLGGLWLSRRFDLGAWPIVGAVGLGVALSFGWVYRTLTRHFERREPEERRTDKR
ncbi:MAG: AtpZ/AtpI family protein [Planctomycetota bacterium]